MNQSFLETYDYLTSQNKQKNPSYIQGLWLIQGDEPLMNQWVVDALRPIWRHHQQAIKRIDLISSKTWQEVITELDSLSLFDPASAIIVTGNHKPDKDIITALHAFSQRVTANAIKNQNNNAPIEEVQHHLVWLTSKLDKKSLSTKWIAPFTKNGHIIDCHIHNEKQRLAILQSHARQFGLQLSADAWQLLMSHTQNNLLNAYQTLWRLSELFSEKNDKRNTETTMNNDCNVQVTDVSNSKLNSIDLEKLQQAIVSESKFNIYDLSDAMLTGNAAQVVKIINGLQTIGEPATLVLWSIAKDMRLIQQLQAGKEAQKIGIWRNKENMYHGATRRLSVADTKNWSSLLFKCDQSVKGIISQPIWELLLQSALRVTGVKLFDR